MTEIAKRVAHYVVLIAITVLACGVMWYVSSRSDLQNYADQSAALPPVAAQPKALVAVSLVEPELTELTLTQSGKLEPWETYTLGFEVAGRVQELGVNAAGEPLDDGDRVEAGQVLARLDDRIYAARKSEAIAQLERAASDLERDRRLYEKGQSFLTDSEYQASLANHAAAKAQNEVAIKNLEDTTLRSPVAGTINRRMIEPGESVTANEAVFEIVENDRLLLVVDVPESRVRELEERSRQVRSARQNASISDPEEKTFRARVRLEGQDAFGKSWPEIEAEVYRIAQVADPRTKLFPVEILIDNSEGLLRPGMVATADIVIDRVRAYRLPDVSVIFRDGDAYLFSVQSDSAPMEAMFWQVGETDLHLSKRIEVNRWVDQGEKIIVPTDGDAMPVVIRGQQRLRDGQHVRVVNPAELRAQQSDSTVQASRGEIVGDG